MVERLPYADLKTAIKLCGSGEVCRMESVPNDPRGGGSPSQSVVCVLPFIPLRAMAPRSEGSRATEHHHLFVKPLTKPYRSVMPR